MKFVLVRALLIGTIAQLLVSSSASAVDGSWITNASGSWSVAGNWASGTVPGGTGSTVNLTNNISGVRNVNIDTTPRTVGILNIGDTNGSHAFTLSGSNGGTLTFDNGVSSAQLNFVATGAANTVSAPVLLGSSLTINNASAANQTIGASSAVSVTAGTSGTKTITNTGTGSGGVTITGTITNGAGTVALVQNSSSTLTLTPGSGPGNTYSGGTTITDGRVRVGANNVFGTGMVLFNGGTISGNNATARSLASSVTFGGNVVFGDATDTGSITFANSGSAVLTGNRTITTLNALQFNGAVVESGGSYGIIKEGAGSMAMTSSSSSFSGGLTLNAGRLIAGNSTNVFGTGTLTLNSGTLSASSGVGRTISNSVRLGGNVVIGDLVDNGTLTFSGPATLSGNRILNLSSAATFNGGIGDAGGGYSLTKQGVGLLTLSGANTFSGGLTISQGTVLLTSSTAALLANSTVTMGGGNLTVNIGASASSALNPVNIVVVSSGTFLYGRANNAAGSAFSSDIQMGTLSLGGNTLTYAPDSGIDAGTAMSVAFGATTLGSVSSATSTLNPILNGNGIRGVIKIGSVTGSAGSGQTNTLNLSGGSVGNVVTGAISNGSGGGKVALLKTGSSSWSLSNVNSYTGSTVVSEGTLMLSGTANNIANSPLIDVAAGATLDVSGISGFTLADGQALQGSGTIEGALTIGSGATLAIGSSPGTMTFADGLTLAAGSISSFEINGLTSGLFDLAQGGAGVQAVAFGGSLNLVFQAGFNTLGTIKIFDFENYSGAFAVVNSTGLDGGYSASFNALTGEVTVVPEPSTWALAGLAFAVILGRARFRRVRAF